MVEHRISLPKVKLPFWARAQLALTHGFIRMIQWLQVPEFLRAHTLPDFFHDVCLAVDHAWVQIHNVFYSQSMTAIHVTCKLGLQLVLQIASGHRALNFRWHRADALRLWVEVHAEDQGWGSLERDRGELFAKPEHCRQRSGRETARHSRKEVIAQNYLRAAQCKYRDACAVASGQQIQIRNNGNAKQKFSNRMCCDTM